MESKTFGEVVKLTAKAKKVSLYSLALKTGRNPGSIYKMVNESNLRTPTFLELMEALDAPVRMKVGRKYFNLINNKN